MVRYRQLPLLVACLCLPLTAVFCADEPENPATGPCPGESGFGARVSGSDDEVDVCVPDDSVLTVFTYDGWYDVTANWIGPDGSEYEFRTLFPHHSNPRPLNVTDNLAEARADPSGAWFFYRETPPEGDALESVDVVSGAFQLGYSDTKVVAGAFSSIRLEMKLSDTDEPAGTRTIMEGFFSILTDLAEDALTD
jgi:hypothetical protein